MAVIPLPTFSNRGILLPVRPGQPGPSATVELREFLGMMAGYLDPQGGIQIPADEAGFRKGFAEAATQVELHRISAGDQSGITCTTLDRYLSAIRFGKGQAETSLNEAMREEADPFALAVTGPRTSQKKPEHQPSISYRGKGYYTNAIAELARRFLEADLLTEEAAHALRRASQWHYLDLRGQKFVLLGGTAEYAPAALLLQAGADVLVINQNPVKLEPLLEVAHHSQGRLHYVPRGADLLREPQRVVATIIEFAGEDKVHLGAFGYKGREGREVRLALAQQAIIERVLPHLSSVFALRSPSMPTEVSAATAEIEHREFENEPWWQRSIHVLSGTRLFSPNIRRHSGHYLADASVPLQGASYLFGQYLKALFMEKMAAYGLAWGGVDTQPITVAAPVAPIARTDAMLSGDPRIAIALGGAAVFGIEVFDVRAANDIMGLILLDGLLSPEAAGSVSRASARNRGDLQTPSTRIQAVGEVQVHGNIFTNRHALRSLLTPSYLAARLGLGRKPA